MDPLAARASEDYHRLLRDDKALVEELEARFFERMREARLTFGGRVLCAFPRPSFVAPSDYEAIRTVCRDIFQAVEKVEKHLGEELWDRVDVTPEERELVRIDPGYRRSSPTSRLDSFITTDAYRFVELNAESPAGIAYNEVLVDIFLELPVMKRFQERWKLRRFQARERLLETLIACHREAGGREERPTIAIVDYEEVPTRSEHHLFREFFESNGYPALVCDPRHLAFEGGRLRHDGTAIDIVYKRLLTNEFLETNIPDAKLWRRGKVRDVGGHGPERYRQGRDCANGRYGCTYPARVCLHHRSPARFSFDAGETKKVGYGGA